MHFSDVILTWYDQNHRKLPWRESRDPYEIWVSEVILQQTRVEQGMAYYYKFLEKFPDISSLATSPQEEVLKVWQGLGYYSRARNMHQAAQMIVEKYQGHFPGEYDQIRELKGVGDYTAAALASFAFGLPYPAIDGNVLRFIARLKGMMEPVNSSTGKKLIKDFLDREIDRNDPGLFNQAIMEMGALVCTPRQPACFDCPVATDCVAYNTGLVDKIPVKDRKAVQKARYFHYLVHLLRQDNQLFTFIRKRSGNDIWKNLYEFPMIEANQLFDWKEITEDRQFKSTWTKEIPALMQMSGILKHDLSHRKLMVRYFIIQSSEAPEGYMQVKWEELDNFPIHRLMEKILDHANITFSPEND